MKQFVLTLSLTQPSPHGEGFHTGSVFANTRNEFKNGEVYGFNYSGTRRAGTGAPRPPPPPPATMPGSPVNRFDYEDENEDKEEFQQAAARPCFAAGGVLTFLAKFFFYLFAPQKTSPRA